MLCWLMNETLGVKWRTRSPDLFRLCSLKCLAADLEQHHDR